MTTFDLAHIKTHCPANTSTVAWLGGDDGLCEGDVLHFEVTDVMGDDEIADLKRRLDRDCLRLISTDEGLRVVSVEA